MHADDLPGDLASDDVPRSPTARLGAWLRASPIELVGLAVLLLGAVTVTGLVLVDAWRRPGELPSTATVGEPVDAWPAGDVTTDPGHGGHGAPPVRGGPGSPGPPGSGEASSDVEVVVHVSGAVSERGVVILEAGARVVDAIDAAGGLTSEADTDRLNLARVLVDGEQVHVPEEGEPGPVPDTPAAPGWTDGGVVDLNRATQAELETLPGIGPGKAAAIIEHRESAGSFQVPGDIRAVPGIGEATFQRLAERITVR
jgi:competence protein ComEA